jgi:hypothetical protein
MKPADDAEMLFREEFEDEVRANAAAANGLRQIFPWQINRIERGCK